MPTVNLNLRDRIVKKIISNLKKLIKNEYYIELKNEKVKKKNRDGYIAINNSFVFREGIAVTKKSEKYLCMEMENGLEKPENPMILENRFNEDIKFFDKNSKNLHFKVLHEAIDEEIKNMGFATFILIGKMELTESLEEDNNSVKIIFDRKEKEIKIEESGNKVILVTPNVNKFALQNALREHLSSNHNNDNNNISKYLKDFDEAYKKFREKMYYRIVLPTNGTEKHPDTFIGFIKRQLNEQIEQYKNFLKDYKKNLMEIKRIAYNFATDAIKLMRLIMVICDIHPIVLWLSICEMLNLKKAFKNLPEFDNSKPKLDNYRELISKTRNKSFHNFFNIEYDVVVDLENFSLKTDQLILFREFKKSRKNLFDSFHFKDKEIIEALLELSRTSQEELPEVFWERNLNVLESFYNLLDAIENALWIFKI
jgi:hypothetical protein